jgi:hypothetical protein
VPERTTSQVIAAQISFRRRSEILLVMAVRSSWMGLCSEKAESGERTKGEASDEEKQYDQFQIGIAMSNEN